MTDSLRLRAYNVLFGDAFLLTIPDRDKKGKLTLRHLLIDVGNAWQDQAGGARDTVFEPVVRDILAQTGGKPLDLYISTHEHMDHVQGLRYVARHTAPAVELSMKHAWLTASADPEYYARFPNSEKKRAALMLETVQAYARALAADGQALAPHARLLLDINDPSETDKCTLHLLERSQKKYFLHRGCSLAGKHPFKEVRFDLWAPELDTSIYYHPVTQLAAALSETPAAQAQLARIPPPPGVDASAFNNLLTLRRQNVLDTLLNIDKAANNTSLVFTLEWHGWKLLFAADAEQRSWEMMEKQGALKAVDFIKISHHGSGTGTPPLKTLQTLFPAPGAKKRLGLVSTFPGTYAGVPNDIALGRYQGLGVELVSVGDLCPPGGWVDLVFADGASAPQVLPG